MTLYRGTRETAANVGNLSLAAYSAATALMTVQQGGRPMALREEEVQDGRNIYAHDVPVPTYPRANELYQWARKK